MRCLHAENPCGGRFPYRQNLSYLPQPISVKGRVFHGMLCQSDRPLEMVGRLGPDGANLRDRLGFQASFNLETAVEQRTADREIPGKVPLLQA
jgi:hypothetical protein